MQTFMSYIKRLNNRPYDQISTEGDFLKSGGYNTLYYKDLSNDHQINRILRRNDKGRSLTDPLHDRLKAIPFHQLFQEFVISPMVIEKRGEYIKQLDGDLFNYTATDVAELCQIFYTAMRGLNYLHGLGLFHLDLKPKNILHYRKNEDTYAYITDLDGVLTFDEYKKGKRKLIFTPRYTKDYFNLIFDRKASESDLKAHDYYGLLLAFLELVRQYEDNCGTLSQNRQALYQKLESNRNCISDYRQCFYELKKSYYEKRNNLIFSERRAFKRKLVAAKQALKVQEASTSFNIEHCLETIILSIPHDDIRNCCTFLYLGDLERALGMDCFQNIEQKIELDRFFQNNKREKYQFLGKRPLIQKYPNLSVYPRSIQLFLCRTEDLLLKSELGDPIERSEIAAWSKKAQFLSSKYANMPVLTHMIEAVCHTFKEIFEDFEMNDDQSCDLNPIHPCF